MGVLDDRRRGDQHLRRPVAADNPRDAEEVLQTSASVFGGAGGGYACGRRAAASAAPRHEQRPPPRPRPRRESREHVERLRRHARFDPVFRDGEVHTAGAQVEERQADQGNNCAIKSLIVRSYCGFRDTRMSKC